MVMGSLRTCYSSEAVFWPGGPRLPIVWYHAAPGAKPFPSNHYFGSSVWDADKPFDPPVGEQGSAARRYSKGQLPDPRLQGDHFCGSLSDFEGGGAPGSAVFSGVVRKCCLPPGIHPVTCCPGVLLPDVLNVSCVAVDPVAGACLNGVAFIATWNPALGNWGGGAPACGDDIQATIGTNCEITTRGSAVFITESPPVLHSCVPFLLTQDCLFDATGILGSPIPFQLRVSDV